MDTELGLRPQQAGLWDAPCSRTVTDLKVHVPGEMDPAARGAGEGCLGWCAGPQEATVRILLPPAAQESQGPREKTGLGGSPLASPVTSHGFLYGWHPPCPSPPLQPRSALLAHMVGGPPPNHSLVLKHLRAKLNSGGILAAGEGCLPTRPDWAGQVWSELGWEGRRVRSRKFASWP